MLKNILLCFCFYISLTACSFENIPAQKNLSPSQKIEFLDSLKKYIFTDASIVVISNATIIDGTGGPILKNQSLVIKEGQIVELGEASKINIPNNAKLINAKGKTLIPGIVGIHNHLHIPGFPFVGEVATRMYLACGVTTIQTCGSAQPYQDIQLAQSIAEGKAIGPDIVLSGPYINGKGGSPAMIIARDEQHLRDTISYWIDKGVEWFKVYRQIAPNDLKNAVNQAHKKGAKITGHLCSVTIEEAIQLGIDGIEHGLKTASDFRLNKLFGQCSGSREYMDSLHNSDIKIKALHQLMIDSAVFLTSTLSIYETSIPNRAFADARTLKVMSPNLKQQYQDRRKSLDNNLSNVSREKRLKRIMAFEYQFFKMGGLLGCGIDPGRHNLFGFGDQRNYQLLIEAGFTPSESIMIMSHNGAKILSKEHIGTLEVGKRADIVFIDGDLLEANDNIKNVELVFKNGIAYDSKVLLKDLEGKVGIE